MHLCSILIGRLAVGTPLMVGVVRIVILQEDFFDRKLEKEFQECSHNMIKVAGQSLVNNFGRDYMQQLLWETAP